jgi:endoplasmic reticulum-Golgi intermediate compartment protein 3
MDVAGDNQLNIEHDMIKQRLSPQGLLVGDPYVELIGQVQTSPPVSLTASLQNRTADPAAASPDDCGSCYGAESDTWKCCNSCDDLKLAYDAKGWATNMILKTAEQCLRDKRNPYANVKPGEGCQVSGSMVVNKVAGNFHMTLGESFVRDGAHIHQFIPAEAPGFNVSHTIHSLSFGETYPSMPPNPLDNGESISAPSSHRSSCPLLPD